MVKWKEIKKTFFSYFKMVNERFLVNSVSILSFTINYLIFKWFFLHNWIIDEYIVKNIA
jgi:hypothetical protein